MFLVGLIVQLVQIRHVDVGLFLSLFSSPLLSLLLLFGLLPFLQFSLDQPLLVLTFSLLVASFPLFLSLGQFLLSLDLVLLVLFKLGHADGSFSLVPPVGRGPTPGAGRRQVGQTTPALDLHARFGIVADSASIPEVSSAVVPRPPPPPPSFAAATLFLLVSVVFTSFSAVPGQEIVGRHVWDFVGIDLGHLGQGMSIVLIVRDLSVFRGVVALLGLGFFGLLFLPLFTLFLLLRGFFVLLFFRGTGRRGRGRGRGRGGGRGGCRRRLLGFLFLLVLLLVLGAALEDQLPALGDPGVLHGPVLLVRVQVLHLPDDLLAGDDGPEDAMESVQVGGRRRRDEKLGSVGVLAPIGHAEEVGPIVLHAQVLVLEGAAENGLATGAVAVDKVPSLNHEVLDDPVEDGSLVVERLLRGLPDAGFPGTQGPEVLHGLGGGILVQLEHDPAHPDVTDGDVEEAADLVVRAHLSWTIRSIIHSERFRRCFRLIFPPAAAAAKDESSRSK